MAALVHRRLRAPTEDGTALIWPPLDEIPALIEKNRAIVSQFQQASGFSAALAEEARRLLIDPPRILVEPDRALEVRRPIILTGHQPELFHPGVWFKNVLAAAIAKRSNSCAVNLIVDNDLIRTPGIRVPTGSAAGPLVAEILFDEPQPEMTWENRHVANPNIFRQFLAEVRDLFEQQMKGHEYGGEMVLDHFWPHAIEAFEAQDQEFREFAGALTEFFDAPAPNCRPFGMLGECFSSARRRLEAQHGIALCDCSISVIAEQRPFHEFMRLLLLRVRELHEIHNRALADYRAVNHIRSKTHPVPELAADGGWFEVPLWISTFDDPRRRRAFARLVDDQFELTDRDHTTVSLPQINSDDWRPTLVRDHIKVRPRALMTTMYARLVLSDLFIHGIGGAKYDELTDLIIRRFFGIEPPAYVTATATFRLPIERPNVSIDDVQQSARRVREVRYRPESFLAKPAVKQDSELATELAALAEEKRAFLDQHDLRRCSADVFKRLDAINRAMHDLLRPLEQELRARHAEFVALARQSEILGSREFSFVLFPAEKLPARLLDLSKTIS